MCQLTFFSLPESSLIERRTLSYFASFINSEENRDGFGIFTPSYGVYKTGITADLCVNLGDSLSVVIDREDTEFMQHVRASSYLPATDEFAHPFESTHYILMHNGFLEYKNSFSYDRYKNISITDSQIFLNELEKAHDVDITVALKAAYKFFRGKFAFMIYDKTLKKFYAARGETANLCTSTLFKKVGDTQSPVGYVVNTDAKSMDFFLRLWENSGNIIYQRSYLHNHPRELDNNSIYELCPDAPKRIGSIFETKRFSSFFAPLPRITIPVKRGD
jgi:predicted glutamine amidotransferase